MGISKLKILFLALTLLSPVTASAANRCVVKNQVDIPMPPERSQGKSTSLCFAFSITALLDHHRCVNGKKCSFKPDELLSPLDVAGIGNRGSTQIGEGGFMDQVLYFNSQEQYVALNKCSPFEKVVLGTHFERFFHQPKKSEYVSDVSAGLYVLQENYKDVTRAENPCNKRESAESLKAILELNASVEEIEYAYGRKFPFFVYSITVPRACRNQRVPLPPFKSAGLKTRNIKEAQEKLDSLLDAKTPVAVALCLSRGRKTDRGPCGRHALVASGKREVCCGNTCRTEYKVHDSSDLAFPEKRKNEDWVDGELFLQQIERNIATGWRDPLLNWVVPTSGR